MNLQYVSTNIPGPGCNLDDFHSELPGCDCDGDKKCDNNEDCICLRYGPHYDLSTGYLLSLIHDGQSDQIQRPVFECGSSCSCGPKCGNRVVQFGIQVPLDVFDAGKKGCGLRTLAGLSRGQFVCEYAGELIDLVEASKRFGSLRNGDPNFIFVLREHSSTLDNTPTVITTCVDPTHIGNLGRFVNHSCNPNLTVIPIRFDSAIPHLGLFANRDIDSGEELCYDYGTDYDTGEQSVDDGVSTKLCLCGSAWCRGRLPLDRRLFTSSAPSTADGISEQH